MWVYSDFSFSRHIQNTCKSFFFAQSRYVESLRGYLPHDAAVDGRWLQMLWLVDNLTTVMSCVEVFLFMIFRSLNVSRTILLESLPKTVKYSHITPVEKKSIGCLLNIALCLRLPYKLLQSGYPKYFEPFLKTWHSVYNTHTSQVDGVVLEVPHFASSGYKST